MTTVAEALAEARGAGLDRLDAQVLLAHRLERPRSWLVAHDDARVPDDALPAWRDHVRRRAAGEPLAYIVGSKEFHGLDLQVTPDVLVPRPDTETLVDWALELIDADAAPAVVDLGTGSGAIALAVKAARPRARMLATDASAAALAVARRNAAALGLDVAFAAGDWWSAVGDGQRFDVVLSNPPYVAAGDPHLAALRHEPALALSPGNDGLEAIRTIVAGAGARLADGGWLLLEHGHDQHDAVARLLGERGFADIALRRDLAGVARCTGACHLHSRGRLHTRAQPAGVA